MVRVRASVRVLVGIMVRVRVRVTLTLGSIRVLDFVVVDRYRDRLPRRHVVTEYTVCGCTWD